MSMYLMTHWPRRQINIFTACRIQSNANDQITLSLSSETLPAPLRFTSSGLFIRSNNDQASLASGSAVWRDWGGKSAYSVIRRQRMEPTGVERLSEPLCPDSDVCPPPYFNVNSTLTSFSASKTHIQLPSLRTNVDRIRPMSNILAIRLSDNGRLQLWIRTESILNGLKNLWDNHSTRLWCV